MKSHNVVPILKLQESISMSNAKFAEDLHEKEVQPGKRLEAWDDLTGLPLDPKKVLEARESMDSDTRRKGKEGRLEDYQDEMDRRE